MTIAPVPEPVAISSEPRIEGEPFAAAGPHCLPEVIEAFKKIWDMAGRGAAEYEAALRLDRSADGGSHEIVFVPMSGEA